MEKLVRFLLGVVVLSLAIGCGGGGDSQWTQQSESRRTGVAKGPGDEGDK